MSIHLQSHLTRKREITVIDKLMQLAAIVHPVMATPQVYKIYDSRNVSGISLSTWVSFMVLGSIF